MGMVMVILGMGLTMGMEFAIVQSLLNRKRKSYAHLDSEEEEGKSSLIDFDAGKKN